VSKKSLARELAQILEQVLAAASMERHLQQAVACLTRLEATFRLTNDPAMIRGFVTLAQRTIVGLLFYDDNTRIRLAIALEEALTNALYHGNLQVSSELRQRDDQAYHKLAAERRELAPYRERCLHVELKVSPSDVTYIVRDEGPGFDPSTLPDPTDPANLEKPSGRGLLLMQTFMDQVYHNDTGNQVTMVKRRGPAPQCGAL
jgi:anti-sigma regulatory factor (Ser/Thr protein kinase)